MGLDGIGLDGICLDGGLPDVLPPGSLLTRGALVVGGDDDRVPSGTTPPRSATRVWTVSPMRTVRAASFTGTLVKLRHPRIFLW